MGMLCLLHLTGKARKTRAIDANTKFSRNGFVGKLRANELDKSVGESRLRVAQRLSAVCEQTVMVFPFERFGAA